MCEGCIKVQFYIQTDKNSLKTIKNIQVHIKNLKAQFLKLLREEHDWVDKSKVLYSVAPEWLLTLYLNDLLNDTTLSYASKSNTYLVINSYGKLVYLKEYFVINK